MSETSWLASPSVDGNTDVNNILDIAEEVVDVRVRHLEGKVSKEEGLAWFSGPSDLLSLGARIVDDQVTALKYCLMSALDGSGGLLDGLEGDISEPWGAH